MATRALLLSGIAAFGIGLVAAGALFHEPGGGERHYRRSPPSAPAADLNWQVWRPSAPAPGVVPEPTIDAAVPPPDLALTEPEYDPNAVWATPAEWSETD